MAKQVSSLFSMSSYNLHGLNQGESLLCKLCNLANYNIDCICVQEHWLTSANLQKMSDLSKNYTFFGSSAMDSAVEKSVLRGRPYGGVGILLKNELCQYVVHHVLNERFAVICFENLLIISVYLLCINK